MFRKVTIKSTQSVLKTFTSVRTFSSSSNNRIYPDQIIDQIKSVLSTEHISDSKWVDTEAKLMENINFFDADQYVDTVSLIAYANQGTEALWDMLSRKIFDYELDIAQTYMLNEALKKCNKHEAFMTDNIARDNIVYDVKWPEQSKVFLSLH
jgi:hypothetical protein